MSGDLNREQRRTLAKKAKGDEVRVANILVVLANGSIVTLDLAKVTIVDKATQKPLFK